MTVRPLAVAAAHLSPASLRSRVSADVHEWRDLQLEEALPVPTRLHRAPLPVSAPADAAGPGGTGQQAAHLPLSSESRRPEARGAAGHRAHPVDANALRLHPALSARRASLI